MAVLRRYNGFSSLTDYARAKRDSDGVVLRIRNTRVRTHGDYFDVLFDFKGGNLCDPNNYRFNAALHCYGVRRLTNGRPKEVRASSVEAILRDEQTSLRELLKTYLDIEKSRERKVY